MSYTVVNDCKQIDLNRHTLIEASAGTGKTYMIENLVVRLLKENHDLALENILMVTYTEKAACELNVRIREKLEQELRVPGSDTDVIGKIEETLDTFDNASIHTIHGFCHSVLRDFAFENGNLFNNEVVDDGPVFDALLKEQMRKTWPNIYGEHLLEILHLSRFHSQKDHFLSTVADIAVKTFRPIAGDRIIPDNEGKDFHEIRGDILAVLKELKTLMDRPVVFSEGYGRLNIHKGTKRSVLEKIIYPLEIYLSETDEDHIHPAGLSSLIEEIQNAGPFKNHGMECLAPNNWTKKGPNPGICPNMEMVAEKMKSLMKRVTGLMHLLANQTIKSLQRDALHYKKQNGWISYDDMLTQVESALRGEYSSALVERLRRKYKVAFVDEFQDTDPVQWKIFQKVFVEGSAGNSENRLYLIGDPKQAIYSFRGADVYTYLTARNEMERLSAAGKANLYSLATNWRSQPELIHMFNRLFCREDWFPPQENADGFQIGYQSMSPPDKDERPEMLLSDHSLRCPFNIVDLRCQTLSKSAKVTLAKFIAAEIEYLVTDGGIEIRTKNSSGRPLDFGDICILVRGKSDVSFLEPELAAKKIPYTFYKKPGLFFSDESLYLSLVFHAILDPGNDSNVKKALMTPFFEYESGDLFDYEDLSVSHPMKRLLLQWNGCARSRRWSLLFQSLMEDSGLLFREAQTDDWERKYTNYRQIFEHLETAAYQKNLDFRGLSALLDGYRKKTAGANNDADIHQIETEDRRVQIMTMHVSKGLEFPVVFIAGGLTQRPHEEYHVYHVFEGESQRQNTRKIIDLSKQSSKDQHDREKTEEDKRLFYVALTRAQIKLYVPFYPAEGRHVWVGPVRRFLASSIESAFPQHDAHESAAWLTPDIQLQRTNGGIQAFVTSQPSPETLQQVRELLPSPKNYRRRRTMLQSFSSLHAGVPRGMDRVEEPPLFQPVFEKDKENDEHPISFKSEEDQITGPADEMPGGTHIGSMFHDILEHIDYNAVVKNSSRLCDAPETGEVISGCMNAYGIDERWRTQICSIITDTLTTPIGVLQDGFILGSLKREERLHEVEFYYPFIRPPEKNVKASECEAGNGQKGFIRGFVDMVFQHGERYYIVDWKSSVLADGYGQVAMKADMGRAGYHLQYKLYTIAVLRWLNHMRGDRYHPDTQFGGVFYVYIRGVGAGNGNGFYYVPPDHIGSLGELEKEINEV